MSPGSEVGESSWVDVKNYEKSMEKYVSGFPRGATKLGLGSFGGGGGGGWEGEAAADCASDGETERLHRPPKSYTLDTIKQLIGPEK